MPDGYPSANYAFDITTSRFITGLITEKGMIRANKNEILKYFPEHERK